MQFNIFNWLSSLLAILSCFGWHEVKQKGPKNTMIILSATFGAFWFINLFTQEVIFYVNLSTLIIANGVSLIIYGMLSQFNWFKYPIGIIGMIMTLLGITSHFFI